MKLKNLPIKIGRKLRSKFSNPRDMAKNKKSNFYSFGGFLCDSVISPYVYAPFREEDKRCFGVMEDVAKYLAGLVPVDGPLFSVVMPVFNRVGTVLDAVDSVLGQSYVNFELIVVDDGSSDGSWGLLEGLDDDRVVLLRNDVCRGVSSARNRGLEVARGSYVAYLDSDNLWDPRFLEVMLGAFMALPDADALYGGQLLFREDQESPFAVRYGSYNKSLLKNINYIDLNSFCHTRDVYQRLGGFDESLERLVDYDLILRYSEESRIYSIPVLLSHYYYDNAENTITKTINYHEHLETVRNRINSRKKSFSGSVGSLGRGVCVVVPSFESLEDIRECLGSVFGLGLSGLEVVVVDNASKGSVVDYLKGLESEGKIKLVCNDVNYGFTYAVNQGIALADSGSDILIMNNDAILTPGAVEALQGAAYGLPDCGVTVPQQVLPGGTKTIRTHVPFAYPDFDCDVNLSAHHKNIKHVPVFHDGGVVELNFAPFFCAYIRRDVLDDSVGLDAEFGRHYRSDRIFCDYVQHVMGLKIYYVADAVVYHKLQKSTEVLRQDKKDKFSVMFQKNQWEPELRQKLGYQKPKWDQKNRIIKKICGKCFESFPYF